MGYIYIDETYHAASKVEYQLYNRSNSQLTHLIILLKKKTDVGGRLRILF